MSESKIIRILIVEDDPMVMKVLSAFIKKIEGLVLIDKAINLESAKKILLKKTIDLILLDVYLPDGNGLDILKWVRVKELDVDVIMITADQKSTSIEKAFRYGMEDYLLKPFKFERFEASIQAFVKKKKALSKSSEIEQSSIDHMMNLATDLETNLGKNQTYERIISYLDKTYPEMYTSTEVAKNLGISRITARRYLDYMENNGEVVLELSYGTVGRPKNKYKLNKKEKADDN